MNSGQCKSEKTREENYGENFGRLMRFLPCNSRNPSECKSQ